MKIGTCTLRSARIFSSTLILQFFSNIVLRNFKLNQQKKDYV